MLGTDSPLGILLYLVEGPRRRDPIILLTPKPAPGLDLRKLSFENPTDSFLRFLSRLFLAQRYASTKMPINPTSAPKHAPTMTSTFGVLGLAPPIVGVSSTVSADGDAVAADVEGVAVAVTVCWVVYVLT